MVPSRLAFLQEFERDLVSISLRQWFEAARKLEKALEGFADPRTLRAFLQTEGRDPRKPQIWRALIRCFHIQREPASLFLLGLLEPALRHLMEKFAGDEVDSEDLWQETVSCALAAISNPRLHKRPAVLAGLQMDTFNRLGRRLRGDLSQAKNAGPMPEQIAASGGSQLRVRLRDELVLARLCRRAGVDREGFALLRLLRLQDRPLTELAPAGSAKYFRLRRRLIEAETRLKAWRLENPDWPAQRRSRRAGTQNDLTL